MRRDLIKALEQEIFKAAVDGPGVVPLGKRGEILRPRKVPRVARRRKREATVEAPCVKLAKGRGWESRKMNGLGYASWPDRLFLPPRVAAKDLKMGRGRKVIYLQPSQVQPARRFWVEFKRPGEELTPRQAEMHRDLRARGEDVYTCDSGESFGVVLEAHSS